MVFIQVEVKLTELLLLSFIGLFILIISSID